MLGRTDRDAASIYATWSVLGFSFPSSWFLSTAMGNKLAGYAAGFFSTLP